MQRFSQRLINHQSREFSLQLSDPTLNRNPVYSRYALHPISTYDPKHNTQISNGQHPFLFQHILIPHHCNIPITMSTLNPNVRDLTMHPLAYHPILHQATMSFPPHPAAQNPRPKQSSPITTTTDALNKQRHHSLPSSSE